MTCKDCKFYENECESHAQMRLLGKERGMEICEIFCKTYVDCWECINFDECHYSGFLTGRLTSCPDYKQKPKTNADRLRAMTDEELCDFLSQYKFCDICEEGCDNCTYHGDCDKRLLDWLQQPAEGDA